MAIGQAVNLINSYSNSFAQGAANAQADKDELRAIRNHYAKIARTHKWEEEKRAIAIDAKTYNNQAVGQQSRELAKS